MSKREQRVIKAFINCVKSGEYSFDYATTLIENTERYGYLSEVAKEEFYSVFETEETVQEETIAESPLEE